MAKNDPDYLRYVHKDWYEVAIGVYRNVRHPNLQLETMWGKCASDSVKGWQLSFYRRDLEKHVGHFFYEQAWPCHPKFDTFGNAEKHVSEMLKK